MSQSDYISSKKQSAFVSKPVFSQLSSNEYLQNKKFYYGTQEKVNTVITYNQLIQDGHIRFFGCEIKSSDCSLNSFHLLCPGSEIRKKYNITINKNLFIDCTKQSIYKTPLFQKNQPKKDCIIPNHHLKCNKDNTKYLKPINYQKPIIYGFYKKTIF